MEKHGDGGRIVVVGGGAIGCAVARALAADGARVTVVDAGPEEEASTWAAGGMLSPLGEAPGPGPFLELALESMDLWADFAASLVSETGTSVGFRRCGKLLVARSDDDVRRLRERQAWQKEAGFEPAWLDGAAARELEPSLGSGIDGALHLPGDGVVDSRALGRALRKAVEEAGRAVSGRVTELLSRGGRCVGVSLDRPEGGSVREEGDAVVLAAGAWSGQVAGIPRPLPVRPVRGQMLGFGSGAPALGGVVAGPGAYLIPRSPGGGSDGHHLVVGATEEEAGFRRETTEDALRSLHEAAAALLPGLDGLTPLERWAGLRPGTPDDLPVLGADPEMPGLFYATGHYRNGLLLTPATARHLADAVLRGEPTPPAFRADRFPPAP